jgi:hypothetical protein
MDKLILGALGALGGAGVLMLVVCFGTLAGGIAGMLIGLVFDAPENFAEMIGVTHLSNFDVGAMLGFAGGFLRAKSSSSSSATSS